MENESRMAGYAETLYLKAPHLSLRLGPSWQNSTLTEALQFIKGQKLNVYTDTKCALIFLDMENEIIPIWKVQLYRKRHCLRTNESPTKCCRERDQILSLCPPNLPSKVAIIDCRGYYKKVGEISHGKKQTNEQTKQNKT